LALEQVSQGKLPPTIFHDHFPAFAVAHAAEFTHRYGEVGSRFLSGLVRLGPNAWQEQADGAADAGAREAVPPQFDASNPTRWYEQIAEYAGQLNARAIKAYRAQLDRVAAGETTPSEIQQQTAEQLAQQLPGYLERMTQLYFDLLNGLNDVRATYEETYFRGLLAAAKADGGDAIVMITLAGPAGTHPAASLSVTNTSGQRAQIGHQIGDVRRVDGAGPSFVPAMAFAPEPLELEADEEGTLTISVWLDPEQYDTGVLCTGRLYLTGASDVPLELELRILASAR
jgi:hypothetical protein